MNTYPYGTGNRLEDRNTYFYSPFVGRDLFTTWKRQRDNAFQSFPTSTICPSEESSTDLLIAGLLTSLRSGKVSRSEWTQIGKLMQRFEVSKRLHADYNMNWRPIDMADYQRVETYVRFAELMDLAYQSSARLQYLNAFLKSMDTLTTLVDRLGAQQINRLEQLIYRERGHVEKLALTVGVTLTEPSK